MEDLIATLALFSCFAFTIAIFVLIIVGAYITRQRTTRNWRDLATRTGLSFSAGSFLVHPSATGTYRDHPLTLHTYTVGSGKNSTRYTEVKLSVENPAGYSLSLRREGVFDALGKKLGMKDMQLGDPAFDQQFVIKSQSPEWAAEILNDGMIRDSLLRIPSLNLELQGSTLRHRETGLVHDSDKLAALFDTLAGIADAVEGEQPERDAFAEPETVEKDEFADDELLADDPFYQKKPAPEPSYPYDPAAPRSGGINKVALIAAFIIVDLVVALVVLYLVFR